MAFVGGVDFVVVIISCFRVVLENLGDVALPAVVDNVEWVVFVPVEIVGAVVVVMEEGVVSFVVADVVSDDGVLVSVGFVIRMDDEDVDVFVCSIDEVVFDSVVVVDFIADVVSDVSATDIVVGVDDVVVDELRDSSVIGLIVVVTGFPVDDVASTGEVAPWSAVVVVTLDTVAEVFVSPVGEPAMVDTSVIGLIVRSFEVVVSINLVVDVAVSPDDVAVVLNSSVIGRVVNDADDADPVVVTSVAG